MLQTIIDNDLWKVQEFKSKSFMKRKVFWYFKSIKNKLLWIVWPRWTGKTYFLLDERTNTPNGIYISCDNPWFAEYHLFDLVKELQKTYWYETFFLDEIQEITNRDQQLKNIYDFSDVKIIFSGSNMIDITRWWYDLSRRAILCHMPLFSFGEFIYLTKWIKVKNYSFQELLKDHVKIAKENVLRFSKTLFQEYIKYWQFGYRYDSNRSIFEFNEKLQNSIKKSVFQDLPRFVDISTNNLSKVRELIYFLSETGTSDTSVNSLAKKILTSAPTTDVYINFLQRAGVVNIIDFYWNISDSIRKNKKYLIHSTNILNLFSDNVWSMRESFFISSLVHILNQSKSVRKKISFMEKTDFVLELDKNKYFFEIWWKSKSRKEEKNLFTIKDDMIIWQWNSIPLWLFGLL